MNALQNLTRISKGLKSDQPIKNYYLKNNHNFFIKFMKIDNKMYLINYYLFIQDINNLLFTAHNALLA